MKVLLLDLESSPNTAHVWGLWEQNIGLNQLMESSYVLCWAAKWLGEKPIYFDSLHRSSAKKMLKGIHDLLHRADTVIHYNGCVAPGHKVLTRDLRWVDVATLKEGDELLAFQEESPGPNQPRRYEVSRVVKAIPILKECSEIVLSDGTKLVASNDHPWLTFTSKSGHNFGYIETQDLLGGRLVRALPTWDSEVDYEAGYLSAFFDGEGCLSQARRLRQGMESEEYMLSVSFAQKDKTIIAKLLKALEHHKFTYTCVAYDKKHPEMICIRVTGGLTQVLRFLGSIRPSKLSRLNYAKLERSKVYAKEVLDVVSVTPIGVQEVIGLETSSRTYLVDGFLCHNTKFDIPTLNKEFILHGMDQPAPYRQMDLLQVARRQFKFASNRLDYVAQALGVGRKTRHEGHELWVKCMNNDPQAWKKMERYNKNDVVIMERVYYKLRPWMKGHTNWGLHTGCEGCPRCGYAKTVKQGYAYTSAGKYQQYQCKRCQGWFRGNKNLVTGQRYVNL